MKNEKKQSSKKSKLALLVLLLCVTVGYAVLSQTLLINGNSTIKASSWNVVWDNIQMAQGNVPASQVTQAATLTSGNTEVVFDVTLNAPGEKYEFNVDALNSGNIDAEVAATSNKVYQVTIDPDTQEEVETELTTWPAYLNYTVNYSSGSAIGVGDPLAKNSRETYHVLVQFNPDTPAAQLPSADVRLRFKFSVQYDQAS